MRHFSTANNEKQHKNELAHQLLYSINKSCQMEINELDEMGKRGKPEKPITLIIVLFGLRNDSV